MLLRREVKRAEGSAASVTVLCVEERREGNARGCAGWFQVGAVVTEAEDVMGDAQGSEQNRDHDDEEERIHEINNIHLLNQLLQLRNYDCHHSEVNIITKTSHHNKSKRKEALPAGPVPRNEALAKQAPHPIKRRIS